LTAGVMLSSAGLAWIVTFTFMSSMSGGAIGTQSNGAMLPIMTMAMMFSSFDQGRLFSFLLIWIVGMVAMMFPAMVPVLLTYNRLKANFELNRPSTRVLGFILFLGGYLFLYAILGLAAFTALYSAFQIAGVLPSLAGYTLLAASGVLIVTGVWQLTPLKDRCLAQCVSPFGFFLMHAKKGLIGAFRMGAKHGYYCVGCCYMYMLVMVGVAAMSIPSMILLATLLTIEKAIARGARLFRWASAALFVALGVALVLSPQFFGFA